MRSRGTWSETRRWGLCFALPAGVMLLGVAGLPILSTFRQSFFALDFSLPQLGRPFVGLANYADVLADSRFWIALGNTLLIAGASVALELLLGLGMALLLAVPSRGRGVWRALILVPWAIPTVVSAQLWRWILNDQVGLANHLLLAVGLLGEPVAWLSNSQTAIWCVILADVWKTTPFVAILLAAGLEVIPQDLYEAGALDGATGWARFRHLTLPLLLPVMVVVLLFRALDAIRIFDLVYVLTGGAFRTETLSILIQEVSFRGLDFGQGAALALLSVTLAAGLAFLYLRTVSPELLWKPKEAAKGNAP